MKINGKTLVPSWHNVARFMVRGGAQMQAGHVPVMQAAAHPIYLNAHTLASRDPALSVLRVLSKVPFALWNLALIIVYVVSVVQVRAGRACARAS